MLAINSLLKCREGYVHASPLLNASGMPSPPHEAVTAGTQTLLERQSPPSIPPTAPPALLTSCIINKPETGYSLFAPVLYSRIFWNIPYIRIRYSQVFFFTLEDMKIHQFVSEKQLFANDFSTVCSHWLILISSFRSS